LKLPFLNHDALAANALDEPARTFTFTSMGMIFKIMVVALNKRKQYSRWRLWWLIPPMRQKNGRTVQTNVHEGNDTMRKIMGNKPQVSSAIIIHNYPFGAYFPYM
jgi:hypothetical protein